MTPAVVGFTGMARYATALHAHLDRRPEIELRPFSVGRARRAGPGRHLGVPLRLVHPLWRTLRWPTAERLAGPVDLVHSMALRPPPTRRPLVITVHDVLPLTHPEFYPPRAGRQSRVQLRWAKRADVVLTTCESTADEIVETLGVPRARIAVAPLAGRDVSARLDEPIVYGPYILAVGAVTPRKGFEVLAEAAKLLGPACPPVVVAGPDAWWSEQVRARIAGLGLGDSFRFLGEVSDADLERLYRHATLVCHPSLAEGFGMACLEAMGFGAAVVAAELPSIREMADGTVVLVPAGDASQLAEAVEGLLDAPGERARLGVAARSRASEYTWTRTADGVIDAYRLSLEGAGHSKRR